MMEGMSNRASRNSSMGAGGAGGALALVLLVTSMAAASSLDRALIRRVIAQRRAEVQACYEELLRREPTAQGKVLLRFTVTPEGKVSEAAVRPEVALHGVPLPLADAEKARNDALGRAGFAAPTTTSRGALVGAKIVSKTEVLKAACSRIDLVGGSPLRRGSEVADRVAADLPAVDQLIVVAELQPLPLLRLEVRRRLGREDAPRPVKQPQVPAVRDQDRVLRREPRELPEVRGQRVEHKEEPQDAAAAIQVADHPNGDPPSVAQRHLKERAATVVELPTGHGS